MRRIGNSDRDAVHEATESTVALVNIGAVGRGKLNRSLLMVLFAVVVVFAVFGFFTLFTDAGKRGLAMHG